MNPSWPVRILRAIFNRYIRWRLPEITNPEFAVLLDYPVQPKVRYGEGKPPHPEIAALLARNDEAYRATLASFAAFKGGLTQIAETPANGASEEPCWDNPWYSALDAIALYGFIGSRSPARFMEIGSGNSTKFVRRALLDCNLSTQIVSIDPRPRAEIDSICDRVIRKPLEDLPMGAFDELEAGDILFVDNSHRVFQNSDATVFFLEVLPRLKPGILVHVHDIFLPFDYPHSWLDRYYSEQYLLAAYLLGGFNRLEVTLPLAYLSSQTSAMEMVNAGWSEPVFQRAFSRYRGPTGGFIGTSFWLSVK